MKHSKIYGWIPSALVGLALSTSVGLSNDVITVDTFDDGGSSVANHMWNWYGGAVFAWDSSQNHTPGGSGSLYISHPSAAGADTIIVPETWTPGSGIWWGSTPVDLTTYTNAQCWFKWDSANSTMTVNNFNTEGQGGFSIYVNDSSGFGDAARHPLPFAQIAGTGDWEQLNFKIVDTIPNINSINAIEYYDWKPAPWSGTVAFWIDDVIFQQGAVFVPPPIVKPLAAAQVGLNCFNSTTGNSFFDRQEVYCITNTGVAWWDVATSGNPVDYSFTIAAMPGPPSTANGCEAWMFLSPNPSGLESAPDWNEANMIIAFVQQDASGNATLHLQYKVNEPSQQQMYSGGSETQTDGSSYTNYIYWTGAVGSQPGGPITVPIAPGINNITNETGNLGSVTNPATCAGKWTVRFTSNTNITIIAPGGDTTNVVITPYYGDFLNPAGVLRIYLGGQANNAAAINQAVVYSRFQLSGTPMTIDDNFATDTTLDTNTWSRSVATGQPGVLIVPTSAKYLVTWTVPAGGFSLEAGNQLTDLSVWGSPSMYPVIPMSGINGQFVDSTEVPSGPNAFFNLIQRAFTQLQVILPGETAVPGPGTGKTGTPTPVSIGAGGLINFTVNACDATWHVISGVFDTVHITTSDGASLDPADAALANGTVMFSNLQFNTLGSQTITATDTTDGSKTPNTSSPVTVTP